VPDLKLKRLGMIMEPRPGDPNESEGVLNPAAVRARDGQLYLFLRLVARGNYSRIGIARALSTSPAIPTVSIAWERPSNLKRTSSSRELAEDARTRA
jgi:hypothetical protein